MIKDNLNNTKQTNSTNISSSIFIRPELFDHLVYPLSIKLDENLIIQLFRKLHIMSTIDYKIKLEEWIEQSMANFPGFTGKY
jgi:hypothetical protein